MTTIVEQKKIKTLLQYRKKKMKGKQLYILIEIILGIEKIYKPTQTDLNFCERNEMIIK